MDDGQLTCSTNIEWLNKAGNILKKLTYKNANLKIIRNEFREMFVEIIAQKSAPIKLQLKGIVVHNKFMHEGKATIKFQENNCTLMLSNAPPSQLLSFLRIIFIKMTDKKQTMTSIPLRTKLLSNKPKCEDEISPLTIADVENAKKKISKATTTTPSPISRKRKLQSNDEKNPKRLYSSPTFNEPLNIQQQDVLDACLMGHNVFFTGSAGTGKSYLLRKIINALPPDVTFPTASTGNVPFLKSIGK